MPDYIRWLRERVLDAQETLGLRYFPLAEVPVLTNRQHDDAVADLRTGRSGVYR